MRSLHRKSSRRAVMRGLAMEYAKNGIRVNAVAPGIVDTPLQKGTKGFYQDTATVGRISEVKDIVDAVVYLTEAEQVTGEVLHVDGGAHVGKW
jgi:NAD(P)-dependent dehydrogenase (short-subunit alcohol dehydrogenase family)